MTPDAKLKSVWNAQPLPRKITMKTEVLLQQIRRNKASFTSSILWSEGFMILSLVVMAFLSLGLSIYKVWHGAPWEHFLGSSWG